MNARNLRRLSRILSALLLVVLLCLPVPLAQAEPTMPHPVVKFAGVINTVPPAADYPLGVWQVAGRAVTVTAATRVLPARPVAVPGMWADVTARPAADGTLVAQRIAVMPAEMRIKGPIGEKPADPTGVGTWLIAGVSITVTAETRLSERGAALEVGGWAEVFATETPTGLVAVRLRGIEAQEDITVFGAIQSFDDTRWVLSSIPITVITDTLIIGTPAVGLLATADATLQANGSLQAWRLKVSVLEPGSDRLPISFTGTVEALPPRGLLGVWTVAGRQVVVSAGTAINQTKGPVAVGAQVYVAGWQADDRVIATLIVVLSSPQSSGQFVRFGGPIQQMPANGLIGEWRIADRTVLVTERTRLAGTRYAKIGARAEVGGMQAADGTVTAAWLIIWPSVGGLR